MSNKFFEVIENGEYLSILTYDKSDEYLGEYPDYINTHGSSSIITELLCEMAAGVDLAKKYEGGDDLEYGIPKGTVVMDTNGWYWDSMGDTAKRILGRLTMATVCKLVR